VTLIELMVVVSIISILAIAAIPAYKRYLIKSRFSEVLVLLGSYRDDLGVLYADFDEFPQKVQNLTDGVFLASSSSSKWVSGFLYQRYKSNQVAIITIYVRDLGIKEYVKASDSTGAGGKYNRVILGAKPTTSGHMRFYCGSWDQTDKDVSQDYLPQSCHDTSIKNFSL
jgi:type II secretory pathway pseudopilin PulG